MSSPNAAGVQQVLEIHCPAADENYSAVCTCDPSTVLPNGEPGGYQNIWTEVYVPHISQKVDDYLTTGVVR